MAAPKGNKYAVGNNGGRPPLYSDPEELQKECDDYFEYIQGEFEEVDQEVYDDKAGTFKIEKVKNWIRYPEPPTITGLTLYLGFCNRAALDDYEKKEEFSNIIKRARYIVEHGYEKRLHGDKNTGAIFALKNMGWKDQSEVKQTNFNHDVKPISKEEIDGISEDLENGL